MEGAPILKTKKSTKVTFIKTKNIHDLDVDKILVFKKGSDDTKNSLKYLIGYNDDEVIEPLRIKLPQSNDLMTIVPLGNFNCLFKSNVF